MRSKRCAFLLLLLWVSAASASGPSLHRFRDLQGDGFASLTGVSDDGSVVVGEVGGEAFRWTSASGMIGLGNLGGTLSHSDASGVSGDGSIVVGGSFSIASGSRYEAFRWTSDSGMIGLGHLPGGSFQSYAKDVSGNGLVVVGGSGSASGAGEAFRWTSDAGMVGLGDLPGGSFGSIAIATSRDGSVVVGGSASASGGEAFRWTKDSGMIGLGDLPGGELNSLATDLSGDGSTVVGNGRSASGVEAFRWTADSGMVGLGLLPGDYFIESEAFGVSDDGSVVVGRCRFASPSGGDYEAFRWTSGGGMERLWDVLVAAGVNPAADGWTALSIASAVSADGTTIVGRGQYQGFDEAFLAFIPAVPEPASVALLTLAAPALMLRRRRRTVFAPTAMSFYCTADRMKGAIR